MGIVILYVIMILFTIIYLMKCQNYLSSNSISLINYSFDQINVNNGIYIDIPDKNEEIKSLTKILFKNSNQYLGTDGYVRWNNIKNKIQNYNQNSNIINNYEI